MDGRRWLFTKKQLAETPSRKCGITDEQELSYRQQAANFIQEMGQRLSVYPFGVNQLCINTAIVYLHRFYMFHSFTKFELHAMSAAALFLAAKVEEQPRRLESIIKVYHLLRTREKTLDVNGEVYLELAQDLVINENVLLQTLGFNVQVDHPHTHVVKTCQLVRASKELAQTSYYLATNSLHSTTLCLQYSPKVVAALCIHLACKWSNWELSPSIDGRDWWQYIDSTITADQLEELTREFLNVLEKMDPQLRQKMLSLRGAATAMTGSPSSSRGASPAPSRSAAGSSSQQHARELLMSGAASIFSEPRQASHLAVGTTVPVGSAEGKAGEARMAGEAAATSRDHKDRSRSAAVAGGRPPNVAGTHGSTASAAGVDSRHVDTGSHAHGHVADSSRPRVDGGSRPRPDAGSVDHQKSSLPQQHPPSGSSSKHPSQPKYQKVHEGLSAAVDPKRSQPPRAQHSNVGTEVDRQSSHGDGCKSKPSDSTADGGDAGAPAASSATAPREGQGHSVLGKTDSKHGKSSSSNPALAGAVPSQHRLVSGSHSSGHSTGSHHSSLSHHHSSHRPSAASVPSSTVPPTSSGSVSRSHHQAGERQHSSSSGSSARSFSAGDKHPSSSHHHQHQHHHRPASASHHHQQQPGLTVEKLAAEFSRSAPAAGAAVDVAGSGHRSNNGAAAASSVSASDGVVSRSHGSFGSAHESHRLHAAAPGQVVSESAAPSTGSSAATAGLQRQAAGQGQSSQALDASTAKRVRSSDSSSSLSSPAKKQRVDVLQQAQLSMPNFLSGTAPSTVLPSMPSLSSETIGVGEQVESHYSVPNYFAPPMLSRDGPRFGENGAAALQLPSNGLSIAAAAVASMTSSRSAVASSPGSAPSSVSSVVFAASSGRSIVASASALQSPPSPHA